MGTTGKQVVVLFDQRGGKAEALKALALAEGARVVELAPPSEPEFSHTGNMDPATYRRELARHEAALVRIRARAR